jgi:ribosomal protein S18 acetylase RimI-like enzyme
VISIELANTNHFSEVLAWLKTENEQGRSGFYCNRNLIEKSFAAGEGLCAIAEGKIVGFAVFQMFTDGGDIHVIEVAPSARGQGRGSQLLLAAVETLRGLGAKYIDVECTSNDGVALCTRHGFKTYVDPRNYRGALINQRLRLYLSEMRL